MHALMDGWIDHLREKGWKWKTQLVVAWGAKERKQSKEGGRGKPD